MSGDLLQQFEEARSGVDSAFCTSSLYGLTRLFRNMARSTKWPTACFVLSEVAQSIANDWEGRPVTVEEARGVEIRVRPLFVDVLTLMEKSNGFELTPALDRLVTTLLSLKQ